MAEPARKTPPAHRALNAPDDEPGILLQRWVARPGGALELVEMPLTPELFLDPQLGDKWMQGHRHFKTMHELFGILEERFRPDPDVLVNGDMKHYLDPRLPAPGPDVSVVRGIRDKHADRESYDVAEEGTVPCLIVEVVSPRASAIRQTDLEDKVRLYERAAVREYLIVDSTRRDRRFRLLGYRLDRAGRYRPIEPDAEGRFLSETTGLWFQASPDGERVFVFDAASGRRLLNQEEQRERADQAEQARDQAAQALEAAEAEIARLKTELDRLGRDG
jgi:Uma2 family endonuclease